MLAFDAGNPALVRSFAAAGHLPNFARLLSSGATAVVEHEPGLFVGSIWPTALTGVGVDRHGLLHGDRPAPFSYQDEVAGVKADPFWVDVARSGRRIAVVDPPFFRAVEGLDGIQLFEWAATTVTTARTPNRSSLLADVVRDVGRHPIGMITHENERFAPCDWVHRTGPHGTPDDIVEYVETVTAAIDRRKQMSKYLLDRGPFDLVVDMIAETHCAGHHLWHLHDTSHPRHDPALVERLGGDPCSPSTARWTTCWASTSTHSTTTTRRSSSSAMACSPTSTARTCSTRSCGGSTRRIAGMPTPWIGPVTSRLGDALRRLPGPARAGASASGACTGAAAAAVATGRPDTDQSVLPPPADRLWYQLDNNTVTGAVRLNMVGREPCRPAR